MNSDDEITSGSPEAATTSPPASNYWGFTNIVSSIKEKSQQAATVIASDIQELKAIVKAEAASSSGADGEEAVAAGDSVNKEAKSIVADDDTDHNLIANQLSYQKVTSSASSFLNFGTELIGTLGQTIKQGADEIISTMDANVNSSSNYEIGSTTDDCETEVIANGREFRLLRLQKDRCTFIDPPEDTIAFEEWKQSLPEEERIAIANDVCEYYPVVKKMLETLVPDDVSLNDFWWNYLYRASKLSAQEQQREKLLEMHSTVGNDDEDEEDLGWGDEESDDAEPLQQPDTVVETVSEPKELNSTQPPPPALTAPVLQEPPLPKELPIAVPDLPKEEAREDTPPIEEPAPKLEAKVEAPIKLSEEASVIPEKVISNKTKDDDWGEDFENTANAGDDDDDDWGDWD